MLNKLFTKKDKRTEIEKEIDEVLRVMNMTDRASEKYKTLSQNLDRLYKINERKRGFRVSPDTIALGVFGIAQMLLLLNYEKADVVTSKALGYVWKGKV